jgi:hypothetical protein
MDVLGHVKDDAFKLKAIPGVFQGKKGNGK